MSIIAVISALISIIDTIMGFFKKSPEEKERDRLAAEEQARRDAIAANRNANQAADDTRGDTSAIEDRFNK